MGSQIFRLGILRSARLCAGSASSGLLRLDCSATLLLDRICIGHILLIGTEKDIPARIESFAKKLGRHDLRKLSYMEDTRLLSQVQSAFKNKVRKATGLSAW